MRIILVEDKKPLANSLAKILRRNNYAVDITGDGEEALVLIDKDNYDLIILDLGLPKIDGLEVIKRLREQKINIPILVLTARNQTPDVILGLNQGADDYLGKPFEVEELLARVQAMLRRQHLQKDSFLTVDNLTLNLQNQEVKRGEKLIDLSKTEYSLLHYLMANQNQVLSKEKILTHVWENDLEVFDRIVDTYIYYLRQKIDKPFPEQPALIKTVKTRGYQINAENEKKKSK